MWFLDWVRVGAFAVLIPYHVGMFYSSWGWLAKSSYASAAVDPFLMVTAPWRLPLLFFVSGAACRFLRDRLSLGAFVRSRLVRLGVPLLFGVLILCAPMEYVEGRAHGALDAGFLQFLPRYWTHDRTLRFGLDWEHLWFVAYVLVYALLAAPLRVPKLPMLGNPWVVALGPLLVTGLLYCVLRGWYPITNNLVRDWSNHAVYLPFFLLGFVAAREIGFWQQVERLRWPALLVAIVFYVVLFWANTQYEQDLALRVATRFARCVYVWAALILVLGFARRRLDRPSATVAWLNRGVFCFYLVHQPAITVIGWALAPLRLGYVGEPLLLLFATIAVCLATYVAAERVGPFKLLFGLPRASAASRAAEAGRAALTPRTS